MTITLIILLAVLALVAYVLLKGAQDAMERNSRRGDWAIFVVRWLDGSHWTGKPQTNAGFRRKGHGKALTQTGYAAPFYYLPRWQRIIRRWLRTFGPFAALGCFLAWRTPTEAVLGLAAASLATWWSWKLYRTARKRWHRRDWLSTVHASMAPRWGVPPGAKPSKWIEVETDGGRAVRRAVFHLPEGFSQPEETIRRDAEIAARRLGMEAPEITPALSGRAPTLMLEASTMPTDTVRLKDVIDRIKNTGPDDIVLGLGKQYQSVEVNLHEDSPHLGASMGAGAGKSTLARFVAAQALYKGAIVVILDIKQASHPWARGLPNVVLCDTAESIHEMLLWLGGKDGELDRRNKVAKASSDYEGNVSAQVGPRILIVAEELNMTANKIRSYWRDELQGQGQPPSLTALQDIAFAGRQVRMNFFMVGQMLTARVTGGVSGGNEARENVGIRMLARYTKRNWNMLVPEFPMPPNSKVLGRIQVVASGEVRECQVTYLTGVQARELATGGEIAALPWNMPGAARVPAQKVTQILPPVVIPEHDQPVSPETSNDQPEMTAIAPAPVTISDAIKQRIIIGNIHTVRSWRRSDPNFPKPVPRPEGGNSLAHYYDPVELADYYAEKKLEGRK